MFLDLFDLFVRENVQRIFQVHGQTISSTILELILGRLRNGLIGTRSIRVRLLRMNRVHDRSKPINNRREALFWDKNKPNEPSYARNQLIFFAPHLVHTFYNPVCRCFNFVVNRLICDPIRMFAMRLECAVDLLSGSVEWIGISTLNNIDCLVRDTVGADEDRRQFNLDGLGSLVCSRAPCLRGGIWSLCVLVIEKSGVDCCERITDERDACHAREDCELRHGRGCRRCRLNRCSLRFCRHCSSSGVGDGG